MNKIRLKEILTKFKELRVGIIGDFALDLYYQLNENGSENSVETGLQVNNGSNLRSAPGGAGNVLQNIAVHNPKSMHVFGIRGDDLFGRELESYFQKMGANTEGFLIQKEKCTTMAYVKPYIGKKEMNRIDFGLDNQLRQEVQDDVLFRLKEKIQELDVLLINQQFKPSFLNSYSAKILNEIILNNKKLIVVADCREEGHLLKNAILKVNCSELSDMMQIDHIEESDDETCYFYTLKASSAFGVPILLTRGDAGIVFVNEGNYYQDNGIFVLGDIDTVGAGDTSVANFALAGAVGANAVESIQVSNMAAAITIKKMYQTGSASKEEILSMYESRSYVYHPKLAANLNEAVYLEGSKIEIVQKPIKGNFKFIIFDNDGTLSTFRYGWEKVMYKVAMECITGKKYNELDDRESRLSEKVKAMIEQTTGIQTIVQMHHLVDLIKSEKRIPPEEVQSPGEYKSIYNDSLMLMVNHRIDSVKAGEVQLEEYLMKGSLNFLNDLKKTGIELLLASGTDEEDVIHEVKELGLYPYFKEKIYGSLGAKIGDAKKKVIQRIIADKKEDGRGILIIGDGPLEIREGKRVGATCIGIASNEEERSGLNIDKRKRLIRAGADIIISDYLEAEKLFEVLF